MTFPRWLVLFLLTVSALSLIGTAAVLWVTWPNRTATAFGTAFVGGDFDKIVEIVRVNNYTFDVELALSDLRDHRSDIRACYRCFIKPEPVTVSEILMGRRTFAMKVDESTLTVYFVANRGSVLIDTLRFEQSESAQGFADPPPISGL